MQKLTNIEATTLSDAWFQTVYKCLEVGREFIIDKGSYEGEKRLEFDWITIHIKHPNVLPLIPKLPAHYNLPDPVSEEYLVDYVPYLMTADKKMGESYTYGSRINGHDMGKNYFPSIVKRRKYEDIYRIDLIDNPEAFIVFDFPPVVLLNQVKAIIETYKKYGHRNNQNILQIAEPSDVMLQDPPCLRHIDTRIQNNKLHFFPYFRSWDLWGGFPANLAAIQMLKEYMAAEIGVEDGEIIASSKGLHIYDYVWELVETIRGKTIEEFRNGK